jgi:hypothetical protein
VIIASHLNDALQQLVDDTIALGPEAEVAS